MNTGRASRKLITRDRVEIVLGLLAIMMLGIQF